MNNESVSFKAYLRSASVTAEVARDDVSEAGASASEVRRFIVDRDVSTSFSYLQEKLVTLFPQLRRADFRLSWTDDDNDDVVIGSDEELIIALTEMKGPVYKINVTIKEKKDGEKPNVFRCGNDQGNVKGEVHEGVTCDACDKGVVGFRYKCVVCPDYDLCGNCEAKGVHPGHNMIRIANPEVAWPHHFFRRLNKMHERANRRCGGAGRSASCDVPTYGGFDHEATHKAAHEAAREAAHEAAKAFEAASNAFPNGHRMGPFGPWMGHGPWARGGGCHRGRGRGGQMWNSMMRGWMGEEQASQQQQQQQQQQEASANAQEGQEGSKTAPPRPPSFEELFANGGEYLRTVGNLVAAALDPLGVNVEIDIEHNGERSNVASSRNQNESKKDDEKVEEAKEDLSPKEEEKKTAEEKPAQEPVVETPTAEPKENSDDEWMVLRHDDATAIDQPRVISIPVHFETEEKEEPKGEPEKKTGVPVAVPINISDQPARVLFGGPDGTLYPELPKQDEAKAAVVEDKPSAPAAAAAGAAVHPDPRIQVALQAMLNMGFTNDGGWLTQLLETKEGDIGKVLDVLQPVKPFRK